MTPDLAIQLGLIFMVATIVATVAGFGNALVAMPLLIELVGVRSAAPMMAMASLFTWVILFIRLRHSISVGVMARVITMSLLTVPLGVAFVSRGPEVWLRTALGVITVAYVLYRFSGRKPPTLEGNGWAYGVGLVGGVLSGAFNTAGPVLVMYGNARGWEPDEFRSNLAGYFISNLILVNTTHYLSGNITEVVWQGAVVAIPFLILALIFGTRLAVRINRDQFSRVVLWLLLVLGIRLALSWLF
jgi:uncharacterized membrane protein YfcA